MCRSINFNLYSIAKIRKYLDRTTVETLVNATITPRLDYCISLMFGILKELISQLQKRQNHAARVTTKWRKYDHITPVLVDLHWLPVKQRIDFKIILLTCKALNGLAPAYMRELLIPYSPKFTLRSMENHLLTPPRCRLEYFGKRSFAAAALTLWKNLPLNINKLYLWIFFGLVLRHICSNLLIPCNCANLGVYALIICYIPWNR